MDHLQKIKTLGCFLFILVLILGFETNATFAESNRIPFSVEPILPDNQDKETKSYISVSPKGNSLSQEFQFQIANLSNERQEIKINIVDAYSSPNGVIQYVNEASENSEIIHEEYKLSSHLKTENDVITLEKNETKIISTKLDVESLEGVLLGGVSFSAVQKGEEIEESDSTFQINNEINMVIGVLVNFDTEKDATFMIESPFLDPMPTYYAIRLPITLEAPVLQQDVIISYNVLYKNKTIFENEKNFNFAPYTKTNISIPFEHNEIVPNEKYTIKGELIYQNRHGDEVIERFEETFIYEKENGVGNVTGLLSPPDEKGSFPTWSLLLLIVPLAIILYVIRKKKKVEPSETH